jgi:DNA-binding XRE family transcriptional regulator
MKKVHTVIHEYRLERSKTQAAMAEEIGVCLRHYRDLEHGKKDFSFDQICTLKEVLKIKIEDLFPPPRFK